MGIGEKILSKPVRGEKPEDAKKHEKAEDGCRLSGWIIALCAEGYAVLVFSEHAPFIVAALLAALILYFLCRTLPERLVSKSVKLRKVFIVIGSALYTVLFPFTAGPLKAYGEEEEITEEEIRELVMEGGEKGSIEETEKEMINNIFEFNDTSVEAICTHRRDIFAIPSCSTMDEVLEAAANEAYTRLPVYSGSIDNIVGILYTKDIFRKIVNKAGRFNLEELLHKPYFVPLSMPASALFNEMRKKKVHIAIVADEYGGTAGIVTMEDLVEEIMGSIEDEYDEEEGPVVSHIYGNAYVADGSAELEAVAEFFKRDDFPIEDYDTLGGFIIGRLERVPGPSERPELEYNGLAFKVHNISDRRITEVIICMLDECKLNL